MSPTLLLVTKQNSLSSFKINSTNRRKTFHENWKMIEQSDVYIITICTMSLVFLVFIKMRPGCVKANMKNKTKSSHYWTKINGYNKYLLLRVNKQLVGENTSLWRLCRALKFANNLDVGKLPFIEHKREKWFSYLAAADGLHATNETLTTQFTCFYSISSFSSSSLSISYPEDRTMFLRKFEHFKTNPDDTKYLWRAASHDLILPHIAHCSREHSLLVKIVLLFQRLRKFPRD